MPTTKKLANAPDAPSLALHSAVREDRGTRGAEPVDDEWDRIEQLIADYHAEQRELWESIDPECHVY